ncbi:MAG: exodeoxyribonuclease VII small subunit [Anaerolineales bacterium]|nr:exodeoxyribonuclease VII small subunit [Anaerolineales bacterium]
MPENESIPELSYEDAYEILEAMVQRLESGNLKLEDALAAFEKGQEAARRCDELLEQAELKLSQLVPTENGSFEEKSWQADS